MLSFNVRSLWGFLKHKKVKELVGEQKVDFLAIEVVSYLVCYKLWGN